jgi:hypothetical protein
VEFPQSGHVTRINNVAANQTISVLESTSSPPALPGDYNQSNNVDTGDYILWRKTLGSSVAPNSGADGSGNGVVDQADYNVWKTHFDMPATSSGAHITTEALGVEPSASERTTHRRVPNVRERDLALAAFDEESMSCGIAISGHRARKIVYG